MTPLVLPATHLDQLAESVHDAWATGRRSQGWTPGSDRTANEHPGLVAYEALPESEKEVDRRTVRAVLAQLAALGYTVVPPDAGGGL